MGTTRKRINIFRERHFGLGIRWDDGGDYPLTLSFAFPFVTVTIGIGERRSFAQPVFGTIFED